MSKRCVNEKIYSVEIRTLRTSLFTYVRKINVTVNTCFVCTSSKLLVNIDRYKTPKHTLTYSFGIYLFVPLSVAK